MEIKRAVSLYFSPTGGTRKIVRALTDGLGAPEVLELDRTEFESRWKGAALGAGDVAVIGMPVYYGRTPRLMTEFFRYLEAEGIPAVVAVVYGNRAYEDALLELKNESAAHGFLPVAAGAFVARHSFTDRLGTGRPNAGDLAQARALGADAARLLRGTENPASLTLKVKGNFPYTPGSDLPFAPVTDLEACSRCMLCHKNCPVQAIHPGNPAEIDGWRCLDCGRCIQTCPTGAKSLALPPLREKIAVMEAMFSQPKAPELFLAE